MPLYEVVLNSNLAGQNCVTRWNYLGAGEPAGISMPLALLSAMGFIPSGPVGSEVFPSGTIFAAIRAMTSANVTFNQITALDVYDLGVFYQTPFPSGTVGLTVIQSAPPFDAMGFRTNHTTRAVRRGTKRFAGIPQNAIGFGGQIDEDHLALMETTATAMSQVLTYDDEGNTLTFNPVIVSKEEYTPDPEKPERKAYRYYPSLTVQLSHLANGILWEKYDTVRSQVSRQIGRGA